MDLPDAVARRLEVREYAADPVPGDVARAVVEAARLAPSSQNRQDWHFLLVDDALDDLAAVSTTGAWVADAAFAVVVLTEDYPRHEIDAGRAITHMQVAAFDAGVGSCIYTGFDADALRERFAVPDRFLVNAVVGFGYPAGSMTGQKDRRPLDAVASLDQFGDGL